jgi:Antibiotic biosynthesis monooxygenase
MATNLSDQASDRRPPTEPHCHLTTVSQPGVPSVERRARPGPGGPSRWLVRQHGVMTVTKINAITVPQESGDELAHQFAARAGAVDNVDGFEGFELLKPTDDREQWLVILAGETRSLSRPGSAQIRSPTAIAPPPSGRAARRHSRSRGTARCGPTSWPADPIPVELQDLFRVARGCHRQGVRSKIRMFIRPRPHRLARTRHTGEAARVMTRWLNQNG